MRRCGANEVLSAPAPTRRFDGCIIGRCPTCVRRECPVFAMPMCRPTLCGPNEERRQQPARLDRTGCPVPASCPVCVPCPTCRPLRCAATEELVAPEQPAAAFNVVSTGTCAALACPVCVPQQRRCATVDVNLRSGPANAQRSLAVVRAGQSVRLARDEAPVRGGWVHVLEPADGYIFGRFLTECVAAPEEPLDTEAPAPVCPRRACAQPRCPGDAIMAGEPDANGCPTCPVCAISCPRLACFAIECANGVAPLPSALDSRGCLQCPRCPAPRRTLFEEQPIFA